MNKHPTGTREQLEQSILCMCSLFPFLALLGKYTYIIQKERVVILSFYNPLSATEKNEQTLVRMQ